VLAQEASAERREAQEVRQEDTVSA
jgi:hypothetical protein